MAATAEALRPVARAHCRLLAQPLLFLVALGFGFGPIYARAGGGNYIQFLAPGVIAMGILFTAMFSGIEVLWDRQFGFLKETLVAPVPRLQVMLGRTLGGATVATLQGVIVFLLTLGVGFRPASLAQLPLALLMMFLTAVLFTALGTAVASVLEDMQGFQLIMNFLVMPLFFLSGALFPLAGLPRTIGLVARSIRCRTASTAFAERSSARRTSAWSWTSASSEHLSPCCSRWAATCFRAFKSEREPIGESGAIL